MQLKDDDAEIRAEFYRRVRHIILVKHKVAMSEERLKELCDEFWKTGVMREDLQ
jgi:hypothetical protein